MEVSMPPQRTDPARVLIVDNHEMARSGMRAMLDGEPTLAVVAEASSGAEALAICRGEQPDLILMDISMPEMDGIATTQKIKREYPAISVIIVTIYDNPDYLYQAIKAGAAGYVLKDATRLQLLSAIHHVLDGEFLLNTALMTNLLRRIGDESPAHPPAHTADRLTPRETEVVRLVAQGYTNPQIARELGMSVGTVKVHVEHIIAKLGASDRTQAAVRAIERGLAPPPSSMRD
jgi:DNA-binding NarL/FixJ family response regulator